MEDVAAQGEVTAGAKLQQRERAGGEGLRGAGAGAAQQRQGRGWRNTGSSTGFV